MTSYLDSSFPRAWFRIALGSDLASSGKLARWCEGESPSLSHLTTHDFERSKLDDVLVSRARYCDEKRMESLR